MTNLELCRNAIGDSKQYFEDTFVGDGSDTRYKLSHGRVSADSETVYVDGTETSDYTLTDDTGVLVFDTAPADGKKVLVAYQFSAFTDTELNDLISSYGVKMASVKAIEFLMADSARRFDYSVGKEDMKPSQIFKHLEQLREIVLKSSDILSEYGNAAVVGRVSGYEIEDDNQDYDDPYNTRFDEGYHKNVPE